MISDALSEQLAAHVPAPIARILPMASGHNATLLALSLKDGTELVAKLARDNADTTLDIEAYMLRYLAEHSRLPVPEVIYASPNMLIMTRLADSGRLGVAEQGHAAELLAALHNVKGKQFGLERDTLIGPLHQPNTPSDSWIAFFAEQRLLYIAEQACREGRLRTEAVRQLEKLVSRLPEWIDEPEYPSLIHGDMWQGNVLAANGGISGFIDPAVYYADPEIELAFSTLFGTFGEPFFARYQQLHPIREGFFEVRRDLYNLYPLLVHVRLYGGGYAHSVAQTVARFVGG